jgi:hypothetical protein
MPHEHGVLSGTSRNDDYTPWQECLQSADIALRLLSANSGKWRADVASRIAFRSARLLGIRFTIGDSTKWHSLKVAKLLTRRVFKHNLRGFVGRAASIQNASRVLSPHW